MTPEFAAAAQRITEIIRKQRDGKKLSTADQLFVQRVVDANRPQDPGRPRGEASKLPIYSSLGECAGATGIPLPLLKQAKKSGCGAFKWNRVDLAEFIKWAFSQDGESSGVDWSNELRKWMAKRAKIAHDRDAREVISLADAKEDISLGTGILFAELERIFTNELPPSIKGLSETAIRDRAVTEIERLKEISKQRFFRTINGTTAAGKKAAEKS